MDRPMLFSAPMVLAILAGRKTVTRRTVKGSPVYVTPFIGRDNKPTGEFGIHRTHDRVINDHVRCPYGVPGNRLIVKESAWMWCERRPNGTTKTGRPKWHYVPLDSAPVLYCADHPARPGTSVVSPETGNQWGWRKKLGRFLPRWASRLTLEISEVRVERLQDISEEDARAEGVEPLTGIGADQRIAGDLAAGRDRINGTHPHTLAFAALWESIQGPGSWAANPWVFAISFRRVEQAKAVGNGA